MTANAFGGGAAVLLMAGVFILGIVFTLAWVVLPFAIVGTKPILRELLAEQKKANATLQHIAARSDEQSKLLSTLVDLVTPQKDPQG